MVNPPRKGRKIYHFSTSPVVNTKRHHLEDGVFFTYLLFEVNIVNAALC